MSVILRIFFLFSLILPVWPTEKGFNLPFLKKFLEMQLLFQ